ncbi:MFS family transporter [Paucilactobacillus oligofermentans DSM 15707 = LMG 22743]|uniref:MFS family transporter n=1 Tax=Paucilactobacillus oligofermentans DSM 15707 = LMG 22743 TaxID=1423778 RepID=A0A0R1RG05_9LACO|nr:MFS transporter [Paucilactobacillus oligofermentans]KRL55718.1 MFS family transporter [Paucilactobacillus oligofermentans DSM 15707 = LMG 22743]CUS27065.1 MFS transporter (lactose) [Paucilactobacillus oligofermentans DSM 15707 = LMG 22743]
MDKSQIQNTDKHSVMMKVSLLSISIILTSGTAIAATIPSWLKAFPDVARSNVELLQTLPSISVVFATLFSSWLAKWIGVKRTVILGLLIAGFAGTAPAWTTNYSVFFGSRLLLGVGFGLVNSYAVSLIGMFFNGQEKANMMGFRGSCEKLGSSITTFVASELLIAFNWHASFWVYGLAFIMTILFALNVPEPDEDMKNVQVDHEKKKQKVNGKVIFWTMFCVLYLIPIIASYTRITELVTTNGYITIGKVAIILSLAQFGGVLTGVIFGELLKLLKYTFLPITLAFTGVSQLMIAMSSNAIVIGAGVILTSTISGIVVTYVFNIGAEITPKNSLNLTTSLMIVGCNIGSFITPLILGWIGMFHPSSDLAFTFYFFGWLLVVAGILMFFVVKPLSVKSEK